MYDILSLFCRTQKKIFGRPFGVPTEFYYRAKVFFVFFCVPHKYESQTDLELHDGE